MTRFQVGQSELAPEAERPGKALGGEADQGRAACIFFAMRNVISIACA